MNAAIALQAAAGLHAHASVLAGPVPNPKMTPIPQLGQPLNTVIGWGKWLMVYMGIAGLLFCAGQMLLGRRGRHEMSGQGAAGIPWVLGGLSLVSISSGIVEVFLHP